VSVRCVYFFIVCLPRSVLRPFLCLSSHATASTSLETAYCSNFLYQVTWVSRGLDSSILHQLRTMPPPPFLPFISVGDISGNARSMSGGPDTRIFTCLSAISYECGGGNPPRRPPCRAAPWGMLIAPRGLCICFTGVLIMVVSVMVVGVGDAISSPWSESRCRGQVDFCPSTPQLLVL
jgi:hypothetical protein